VVLQLPLLSSGVTTKLAGVMARWMSSLAGCSHNTVAHWVTRRDAGEAVGEGVARAQLIDPFLEKVEEWVDASKGKVRADVAHDRLVTLGYTGSDRTTRRAVAAAKKSWSKGRRRVYRPWVPEPGMWFQWDFAEGPGVAGVVATPIGTTSPPQVGGDGVARHYGLTSTANRGRTALFVSAE